ncbi:uncharacterized protein EV422DRAFT_504837 [Fimicolochytrium jonesii]|uniref:uncharacterized protein n=1 Tax=Fimicolochytrium jonesii TaxID=1396493 RepID=UPI0022FDDAFC|nr:uncharacterized protein EV422DRAFT_504837 [Fimicolochytrium jonesii]KAI8823671.1 hypothetical protein EV422DRAFT_504837 [Fimicolochytrium jonesii]
MTAIVSSWSSHPAGSDTSGDENRGVDASDTSSLRVALSPHTALPPIQQRSPTPGSVYSDGQQALDFGEPASENAGHTSLSMRACPDCQEALLGAYNHCLMDTGTESSLLDSLNQIDEEEDGRRLTDPPFFRIIRDPTAPKNTLYTDVGKKVERDRWAFQEGKNASKLEQAKNKKLPCAVAKGAGVQGSHLFSGAIYKRTLDFKDKEIKMLREQLYDKIVSERADHEDAQKLRSVLKKAVNYYVYAEEWQAIESSRLQADVRSLKAELASLMAFLIQSENDKRKLAGEIQGHHDAVAQKEEVIKEKDNMIEEMKSKLHKSFKEFLHINKTMAVLEVEAAKGSEVTQGRNEVLQRNLDKLAREFEITTRDLTTANDRIRELEFELEELVSQFNQTGEGKRAAEEHARKLSTELDRTVAELTSTRHTYEITEKQRRQLEAELAEVNQAFTDSKFELNSKVGELSKDLETVTSQRTELQTALQNTKAENEKLSISLKGVTRSKDQLESAFRVSTQKYEKEISTRDTKIHDLGNLREEDAKALRKTLEQKEQLMYQVTDLQNSLNRETASLNMANFELTQVKRQADEKVALLEDQLEKLNTAKIALAADKRQVTEKYKQTRSELQEKEHELGHIKSEFSRSRDRAKQKESTLVKELAELTEAHTTLKTSFANYATDLTHAAEEKQTLVSKVDTLEHDRDEAIARGDQLATELAVFKSRTERLTADLDAANTDKADVKKHLESVVIKVDELTRTMNNLERESTSTIKTKDGEIRRLTKEAYDAKEEVNRLSKLSKKLRAVLDQLDIEHTAIKKALQTEKSEREYIEASAHDLRQSLHSERQIRLEFERLHERLNRSEGEREREALAGLRLRNRLLAQVAAGLNEEQSRLKELSAILPTDDQLQAIDGPEIKDFKPAELPRNAAPRQRTPGAGPGFKLVVRRPMNAETDKDLASPHPSAIAAGVGTPR